MENMIKCHQCGTLIQQTKNRMFCTECAKERNSANQSEDRSGAQTQ